MRALRAGLVGGLIVMALVVPGCGGDDDEESAGTTTAETATEERKQATGAPVTTVRIKETEFKLDPARPRVTRAGVVEFVVANSGGTVHALEVEGPEGEAETKLLQPGNSARLKVDLSKPGTYTMYCPVGNHRQQGMEGKVSVAGGGTGGAASGESETETEKGEDESGAGGGSGY
jgi:plastocyanin